MPGHGGLRDCWRLAAAALLSGCAATGNPFARTADAAAGPGEPAAAASDRDAEAPEVFQATDLALWDGRPSLGGVWAASPDARDPERVVLRNPGNGKSVVGALFRRERLNPGPPLQISSDAADALGMIAGQPAKISVTALRREAAAKRAGDGRRGRRRRRDRGPARGCDVAGGDEGAGARGTRTGHRQGAGSRGTACRLRRATCRCRDPHDGRQGPDRHLLGGGECPARRREAGDKAGLPAQVVAGRAQDKDFWRLDAGPAPDADALLARVKAQGFPDAFVVNR